MPPQVARQHNIDDVVGVPEVEGQKINVALIGTCTNGRLDDIRQAAAILKGRQHRQRRAHDRHAGVARRFIWPRRAKA